MIKNNILGTCVMSVLLCNWNCHGMRNNSIFDINISSPSYSQKALDVMLSLPSVQKQISNLRIMLEKLGQKYRAYEKKKINETVREFAARISLTPNDEKCLANVKDIINECIDFYNQADEFCHDILKDNPNFDFCLGICGYYFSDTNTEETEAIKQFFKSVTGEDMSKQKGIELINKANGCKVDFP